MCKNTKLLQNTVNFIGGDFSTSVEMTRGPNRNDIGVEKLIFINVFCIKKFCTFAVRNFSRENSVKTHNKLLIKLNGYIKLQNS